MVYGPMDLSWSKVIPILKNAGHRVISVQLPNHSLEDDVATVKRAIDLVGGPTIVVAHSFGGFVILLMVIIIQMSQGLSTFQLLLLMKVNLP